MPRALVASFGFDERFVVRALVRHGIGRGDLVVLVTGRPTEKTDKAYKYVKELAETVDASAKLERLNEDAYSFPKLVSRCRKMLEELAKKYDEVTVLLSGGMRVIVVGLYTAVLLLPPELKSRVKVELDTEDEGVLVEVPKELLALVGAPELGAKRQVLSAVVEKPGVTVEELAKELGKDESTIRRHLQALASMGLVRLEGRPQKAHPSPAARALV